MRRFRLISICAASLMISGVLMSGDLKARATGTPAAQDERIVRMPYGNFGVEVFVGDTPLEALYGRGRSYVEAREGAEYDLVLRNPLPVRVAVALSVDGLNTIDARRSSAWDASKWVIEPYGTIRISGWQMSSNRARRFYFTNERDSYGAKLGRTSDLGVITAVFFRELTQRSYPVTPQYEPDRPRSNSEEQSENESPRRGEDKSRSTASGAIAGRQPRDDGYAATGIGRSVEYDVEWVNMNLQRSPAAEVTIRYEYHDALVRLGVLPRPWRDDGALQRRERARGFEVPAYCPEP